MTKDQSPDTSEVEDKASSPESKSSSVENIQPPSEDAQKEDNSNADKAEVTTTNSNDDGSQQSNEIKNEEDGDEFDDAEEPLIAENEKRDRPSETQDATPSTVEPPTSRQRIEDSDNKTVDPNDTPAVPLTNGIQTGVSQQQIPGGLGSGMNQQMILQQQQEGMTNQMLPKQTPQQQSQLMQQQPQAGTSDPSTVNASAAAGKAVMGNVGAAGNPLAGQSAALRERQLAQMGIGGLPENAAAMQQHIFQQQLLMGGNPFGAQGQFAHLGMAGGNPAALSGHMTPFLPPDQQRRGFPPGFAAGQGPGAFVPGVHPGVAMPQNGAAPGAGAPRPSMTPGPVAPGAVNQFAMGQPTRPTNSNANGTPGDAAQSAKEIPNNAQGVQGMGAGAPGARPQGAGGTAGVGAQSVGAPANVTQGVGLPGVGPSVVPLAGPAGGAANGGVPNVSNPTMGTPAGGAPGASAPGMGNSGPGVLDPSAMPFGGLGRAGMVPGMGGFGGLPMPDAALQQMMLQRGGAITDMDAMRQRMMLAGGMPPGAAAAGGFRPGFLAGGGRLNNMSSDLRGLPGLQSQTPAMSLSLACDDEHLSEYQILVRKQLEVFEAQPEDVESNTQGRKKQVSLGQIGIRCKHCAHLPLRQRGRGAVYYPAKLQGVYQAAQNMASSHLCESCQCIDNQLKSELKTLRERRDTASGGKQYWADGARALGLFEAEDGLRINSSNNSSNT